MFRIVDSHLIYHCYLYATYLGATMQSYITAIGVTSIPSVLHQWRFTAYHSHQRYLVVEAMRGDFNH